MKYKVTFEVEINTFDKDMNDKEMFAYYLEDLLKKSTLPAVDSRLVPLTLSVTKRR